ncbi:MAG: UvrD-helicase domain-containing protein [Tannerella sp.]|jgi:ATP-dependent exoDNAse (exonuclease V) beta subunit|nr:UvrD-helicase domain-containing protein [Tannerella sp.]
MLTIYRASAGAGKTHVLTGEYLQLLFKGVDAHANILSVTFTNKATDEMKRRIIEELHRLSDGQPSSYLAALMSAYRKPEEAIRRQARAILIRILHDYSKFNICTIDHFFQQTIRAFIRETGINGNYHIEMDKDLVLAESVDNLLSDLDVKENGELLKWLLRFSEDKVERGEEWELRREIKKLANELFKEKYKSYGDKLEKNIADKQTLTEYQNSLYAIKNAAETEAKQLGESGIAILNRHGLLPSDFNGGKTRSPMLVFEKWAGGEMKELTSAFLNLPDNIEGCFTKTTKPDIKYAIETAFDGGLNDCIKQAIHFFTYLTPYHTAKEILRNYYTLGILTDISRHIAQWREEKNRMLIADTNELIDKIINGSDVPFIYEKTGTNIDHFMIDEFQDTSRMQWSNFRPLIKESLAYRHANLIVGDIKQSIYRFRNSDWTLLDEQVYEDFSPQEITDRTLTENWRSHRLIVEFNNAFFAASPALLQADFNEGLDESALDESQKAMYGSKIVTAYQHSFQDVSPPRQSSDGHVRIELLPETDECSWKQEAMNRLPALVEKLQAQGYTLKDMAILVRTKAEGVTVAETLLACKHTRPDSPWRYDIISEDALLIANALSIRFIIDMLYHLNRPNDLMLKRLALMTYIAMKTKAMNIPNVSTPFSEVMSDFPAEKIREIRLLSQRSFYETVEGIYRLFKTSFPRDEQAYIQAFLDLAATFSERESADTDKFLRWWEESGSKEKISLPDSRDAIRILTIHKSKGLGFKVVIIPFGDWDMDQKGGSIVWCHPQQAPFDKLQIVPVNYSKYLSNTLFAEDYYHEKLHAYIDNLNALYVAFTRAKEELIVFIPDTEVKRRKEVSKLIYNTLHLIGGALQEEVDIVQGSRFNVQGSEENVQGSRFKVQGLEEEVQGLRFKEVSIVNCQLSIELGNWWRPTSPSPPETNEITMQPLPSILPDNRIMLRLHRNGGFFDDNKRKHGILMHEILSNIETGRDITQAIRQKELSGEISKQESAELMSRLEQLLEMPAVRSWFDGSMLCLNEMEILYGNGKSYRPDRIMLDGDEAIAVDYKFGEIENPRHQQQVEKYMSLLYDSGYQRVKGFLWYVELNKILEIAR